jgi:hypothetical protein
METHMAEEQPPASSRGNEVELCLVGDADVAHAAAGAGRMDRLDHRLLRADALELLMRRTFSSSGSGDILGELLKNLCFDVVHVGIVAKVEGIIFCRTLFEPLECRFHLRRYNLFVGSVAGSSDFLFL